VLDRARSLECRIFIDLPPGDGSPKVGDYVVTFGKRGLGSGYLVLGVRKIQRRRPSSCERFTLQCHRVSANEVTSPRWTMRWYPRTRRARG
jgi:hypothetical protein